MTMNPSYPQGHILHNPVREEHYTESADVGHGLHVLVATQLFSAAKFTPETMGISKDNVRQYSFAIIDEICELAKELNWKEWKQQQAWDSERIVDEYADVLAMLGILTRWVMEAAGVDEFELAEGYKRKSQVNLERMAGKVPEYGVEQRVPALNERRIPSSDVATWWKRGGNNGISAGESAPGPVNSGQAGPVDRPGEETQG